MMLSYSPIKFRRMAIFRKVPSNDPFESELWFERISMSKNQIVATKDFERKLRYNYDGYLVYTHSGKLVGYYWFTKDIAPPTSIPKIPIGAVWIFNMYIFEQYRGNGWQKEMLRHFENEFRDSEILYADILLDNVSSIKNFIRCGYLECGVYYILIFGIRRFRRLNVKIGYWNKSQRHKYNF